MKQSLFKSLLLGIIVAMLPQLASAYDFMVDGLAYNINYYDETSVTVTYTDYSGLTTANIPSTVGYNGKTYSVTGIGDYAFNYCYGLTSVTIGNSVTEIGNYAFQYCENLTSVTIGNSVTAIGDEAFSNCYGLTSMVVENGNTKYDSRNNCNAIIETATNALIFGCKNTIIPNSVTTIGEGAFAGCTDLASVTIPNSVTTIGNCAFYGCWGLTSVTIPNSVTTIGDGAFEGTPWYNNQPDGLVYAGMVAYKYKGSMPDGTTIVLNNGCTGIAERCFYGCSSLTSVTIPNSVTEIGDEAFTGCSGLISVTIPNSVTTIGDGAFAGCTDLASVTIPNSVTTIGVGAFYDTGWYNNQPDGLVYAGMLAYQYKGSMPDGTIIVLNNGCTGIVERCFYGCSGLTSVTIGNSVTSIGSNAFYHCSGLTSVTIPNSVKTIGSGAFSDCSGLTSVTIPNSVTSIGRSAFAGCSGLASVTIPNSVTTIGGSVFRGCSGLTEVTIPNSVTSIDYDAFCDCIGLTSVTIPNSVTKINSYAFYGCSGLTSVTIPYSVTMIGYCVFGSCSSLTSMVVENGNTRYDSRNNCNAIIETESNTLLFGCKNTIIPNSVTMIGLWAFDGCLGLTSVTIPNSVTTIGIGAFNGCSGLASVTIGNSVTSIGDGAFSNCSGLASMVVENGNTKYDSRNNCNAIIETESNTLLLGCKNTIIPNSVTGIGGGAFANCLGLTSVTIPNSVTTIGSGAFYECYNLNSVSIGNSVTEIGRGAFSGCRGLTSVTIPNSVTSIGDRAFEFCSGLTSVSIGNSVTSIPYQCFYGCSGLTSVTIGNSVTTIGSYAFYDCSGLTSVTIPNSVTVIGYWPFTGCRGLTNIYSHILNPENVALAPNAFYDIDKSNCILTIPGGTLSLYQNAPQWKDFLNMVVLGVFVAPDVAHVRGDEHRTHELSINMNNGEAAISGVQFLMTLPTGVSLATDSYGYYDVWLDDDRRARNHSVSVEPRSDNKYFVLISSPTNKTFSGNTGDILHMNIEVEDQYHSAIGDYPITISNIILAEPDETQHNESNAQSTVRMSYLVGDANADIQVDIADYVVTANHILGRTPGTRFFTDAANAHYTNNTDINVTDLVAITNIALGLREKEIKPDVSGYQRAPAQTMPGTDYWLTASVIENGSNKTVLAIAVNNDEPLAAMQFDLDLPEGMALESAAVTDRTGEMSASCGISPEGKARVVLSSFGTAGFNAGSGDVLLLTLSGSAHQGELLRLSNVVMTERCLTEHGATGELMLDVNDITGISTAVYDHVNIYGDNSCVIIESPIDGMAQLVRINGMSRKVNVEPGRNVYPVNVSHGDIIIATFNGVTKKIKF